MGKGRGNCGRYGGVVVCVWWGRWCVNVVSQRGKGTTSYNCGGGGKVWELNCPKGRDAPITNK